MRAPIWTCLLLAALSGAFALSAASAVHAQQRAPGVTCQPWGTNVASPAYTCVSSHLPPAGARSYGPDKLDGISDGAWCEAAPDRGIGQWVSVTFGMPMTVDRVVLTNGYVRTDETFRNNGRVKRMAVETSDGERFSVALKDQRAFQEIRLPRLLTVKWIRFTIEDVFPGARGHDTCLSELVVDIETHNLEDDEVNP